MYNTKRIIGIITARGNSQGVSKKNTRLLGGKPLIAYTIEAARGSTLLTRCIVSTDDPEIADIVKHLGADVPFMRPAELAQADTPTIPVLQHALAELKKNNETYDYVMILQPTSPFRTSEDIDACIRKIVDTDADSVMSMVELADFSPAKLKVIEDDIIRPLFEDEGRTSAQRTEGPKVFKRNAAIYLTKTNLIEQGDLFGAISRPYVMPAERSLDINHSMDFQIAEQLHSILFPA